MKKTPFAIGIIFGVAVFAQIIGVSLAAPYPTGIGGTGTSQTPASGTIPIGNGAGSYTPALITPGTDIVITNASGSVTIAVNASAFLPSSTVYVASVNGQSGAVSITSSTLGIATNTLSLFNGNGFSTTTIQAVLNALSATGLASYNSSTGVFAVSSSSLNLKSASQYNYSDFLPSSTVYVATVNGQSGAVTVSVPATTTVNGVQATVFKLLGDGTTVTSTVNGTTTTFSIINTGNWAGTWQGANSSSFYLASNPNGYISSSTGSGLYYPLNSNPAGYSTSTSGGISTGTVATLGSPLTVGGIASATIYGTPSSSYVANFNNVYQFPSPIQLAFLGCEGSSTITDYVGCLHYIYTIASGSTEIDVGPYNYGSDSASTTFNIANKYIVIKGVAAGGTVFNSGFTASGQCWLTFDIGNAKQNGWGFDSVYINGPNSGGSIGTCWGGTNGAEGGGFHDSLITHFYQNILVGNNTYLWYFVQSTSNFNYSNSGGGGLLLVNGSTNTGETIEAQNSLFADGQPAANQVEIETSGESNVGIVGGSIDDAQVYSNQYGGQGNNVLLDNVHEENPAAWNGSIPEYDFNVMSTNNPYANDTFSIVNSTIQNDAGTYTENAILDLNGHAVLSNDSINNDGSNGYGVFTDVVSLDTTSSTIYSDGITQNSDQYNGIAADFLYGTTPLQGGVQTYNVTSTFGGEVQILSNDLVDANGNKYATSTGSQSTPGYVPLTSSSSAFVNSNIYEVQNVSTSVLVATQTIAFATSTSGSFYSSVTSSTASYSIAASNTALFVGVVGNIGSDVITGVTYAGNAMTLDGKVNTPGDRWTYLYSLMNAPVGNASYTVTASGATNIATIAESLTGVASVDVTNTNTASATTTITTSLTTLANNDWTVLDIDAPTGATASTGTIRNTNGGFRIWDSNGPTTPPGTSTVTFTGSSSGWGAIMAAVAPVPAVTTSTVTTYTGVGTTTPSTALDVNGNITDENVKSAPCTGTNATGTFVSVGCLTSAPATTSVNGVIGPLFTFSINATSSASSITTSSAQLFLNLLQYSSGTDISVSPTGTINFVNTAGYSTSTASTLAGNYLTPSGSTLNVLPTLASSSVAFEFYNATTTAPAFQDIQTANQKNITSVSCFEYSAATTTIELYYNTTLASSGIQQVVLSSLACGINGTSTTSFTTSTLPAGAYLFAIVNALAGTPTLTTVNVQATKQ